MTNAIRILFVSDEVTPFAKHSEVADLVRTLPEKIQEAGDYEARIMMPRYGSISERKNRLHEVIRLSGTDIPIDGGTETLKVKVASIPGIRLQVYFMDNSRFFKRKGIYADKQGQAFEDNPERALFFSRAALETIRNLGWEPDIVHAFGWASAPIPMLLRTEYAKEGLFEGTKTVYTPNDAELEATFSPAFAKAMGLPEDEALLNRRFDEVGSTYADLVVYPPSGEAPTDAAQLSADPDEMTEQAIALYDQVLSGVPA